MIRLIGKLSVLSAAILLAGSATAVAGMDLVAKSITVVAHGGGSFDVSTSFAIEQSMEYGDFEFNIKVEHLRGGAVLETLVDDDMIVSTDPGCTPCGRATCGTGACTGCCARTVDNAPQTGTCKQDFASCIEVPPQSAFQCGCGDWQTITKQAGTLQLQTMDAVRITLTPGAGHQEIGSSNNILTVAVVF